MRRWSLSRKILGLAIVNLFLLAALMLAYARMQYRFGAESLLMGPARDRVLGVANAFRIDMDGTPDVAALLRSYSQRYQAEFFLISPRGHALAGSEIDVPPAVLDRIRQGGPPPPDSRPDQEPPPGKRDGLKKGPPREPFFFAITDSVPRYWAGVRMRVVMPGQAAEPSVLLLRSASLFSGNLFFDWQHWVALAFAVLGVSVLCWLPFLRGLTRSVAQMDRVTEQIAQGRFDARAPEWRQDELGHLGAQINRMAVQLESMVKSQKRFLSDTAHELSAPIARIQFALGILENRVDPQHHADVNVLRDEIQEMSALVNELLSFSKAGLDAANVPLESVNLATLIGRAAAREMVNAQLQLDARLSVVANEGYLLRALANLLRNAKRYASEDGPIVVTASRHKDQVTISVEDHGPGLPEDAIAQIFEPFFRPESSRSRDLGGVGLGMAIVKTCVEACRGSVSCRNRSPRGLAVDITLPAA